MWAVGAGGMVKHHTAKGERMPPPRPRRPPGPGQPEPVEVDPRLRLRLDRAVPPARPPVDRPPIEVVADPRLFERVLPILERHRPRLDPSEIKPGTVVSPVTITSRRLSGFVRQAAAAPGNRVVWTSRSGEVLALLGKTRADTRQGIVAVGITLESEETGATELTVPLRVGDGKTEAGLVAAASLLPEGNIRLAQLWGEAVVATAWQALLDVAVTVAAGLGTDQLGEPLRPAALRATDEGLTVVPQAAHVFQRRRSGGART